MCLNQAIMPAGVATQMRDHRPHEPVGVHPVPDEGEVVEVLAEEADHEARGRKTALRMVRLFMISLVRWPTADR